ncbi:hypothetical protein SLS54_010366 [Diplodia seriata]
MFHTLLHMARPCHSTDSRDKIFALFGMLAINSWKHDLRADYSVSVQRVYTEIAVYFIRRYNTLDILSFVEHPVTVDGLPSWVPDWSKSPRLSPLDAPQRFPRLNHHVPDVVDLPPPQTKWDLAKLAVKGRVIDVVRIILPVDALALAQAAEQTRLLGAHLDMGSLWHVLGLGNAYGRLEFAVSYNIAVSTTGWDPLQLGQYPFGTEVHGVGSLYRGFSSDSRLCTRELRSLLRETEVVGRRRSFLFGTTAIGLGPPQTRAHDLVVLLEGSRRPVVLRRQQSGLELVGECHFPSVAPTKKKHRHDCC